MSGTRIGLWPFAVGLYGKDGVAPACLALQDEAGVDVPLLLCSAWIAVTSGTPLDAADIDRLDAAVRAWREEVVVPLRTVRRRMKGGPPPAPSDKTETLRNRLKEVELGAEHIEIALLESLAAPAADPDLKEGTAVALANMKAVVMHFAGGSVTPAAERSLGVITAALSEDGSAVTRPERG